MWFPPVEINGDTYIDAVYITDANVEEAIRRGADEIWAIWTVSTRDEWRPGFVAQYFQIIETVADANFFAMWERIDAEQPGDRRGQRRASSAGPITLKLLEAEVPVHYLFNFSRDRMAEAVNLGVEGARAWCRAQHRPAAPVAAAPQPAPRRASHHAAVHRGDARLRRARAPDFQQGLRRRQGAEARSSTSRLTIRAEDADEFITDPAAPHGGHRHRGLAAGSAARCRSMRGEFNLFVSDGRSAQEADALPAVRASTPTARARTIVGVEAHPGRRRITNIWDDTTTLYTTIYKGHVLQPAGRADRRLVATGIIRIGLFDFMRQMTTFRVRGPTPAARAQRAQRDSATLFLGKLCDVYGGFDSCHLA